MKTFPKIQVFKIFHLIFPDFSMNLLIGAMVAVALATLAPVVWYRKFLIRYYEHPETMYVSTECFTNFDPKSLLLVFMVNKPNE